MYKGKYLKGSLWIVFGSELTNGISRSVRFVYGQATLSKFLLGC